MKLEAIEKNAVLRLSLDFSVALIDYCEKLGSQYKFVIAKQLLRSGTSIGANAMEAQDGESKRDFIHKMKVAAKEASETQYWLLICERAGSYPNPAPLQSTLIEINRLLNSIIATSKRKNPFSYFLTLFM